MPARQRRGGGKQKKRLRDMVRMQGYNRLGSQSKDARGSGPGRSRRASEAL